MHRFSCWITKLTLATVALCTTVVAQETEPSQDAAKLEFFEKKVRPLLVANCYNCHSANTNAKGGLRVDDRNGLIAGGGSGAAIVPDDPDGSLLIQAVRHDGLEMPPNKKLNDDEVADLAKWIADGATWPAVELAVPIEASNDKYERLRKEHWAWQSVNQPSLPEVKNAEWPRDDVDRFILASLEAKGLAPVADADRATLVRRIYFDLTGLPPSPEEVAAFVADDSTSAVAAVVDRLLASPAFGERWGRHWLDVARYAESTGSSRNVPYPHAWRYRDYVVDSLNRDKPYNQFIREQVAGDLLPSDSAKQREEQLVATGFLALGVKDVNQRFKVRFTMDNIDEQIDTVSRSVLGLTASCARCHDHKFDPIPTKDYYALAGIFHSTEICAGVRSKMGGGGLDYYDTSALLVIGNAKDESQSTERTENIAALQEKVAQARKAFQALRDDPKGAEPGPNGKPKRQVARQRMNKLQAELTALSDPAANGATIAYGVREAKTVGDTEVRIRGEAEKLGPVAPRGFLSVVNFSGQPQLDPAQSGRLQLADWLASEQNPLTSRVIVNRVWQHLFGQGLVKSSDNFGVMGDTPSHPELLDHLAVGFTQNDWSIKQLVRSLVLSRSYQLSSQNSADNFAADPENRLVWRHSIRRLSAEEIRDAALAASGRLKAGTPEASQSAKMKVVELRNNGPEARELEKSVLASEQRSLYLPLLRGLTPTALEVFDFAEQGMVTGNRDETTVAVQALYLLNDPFVRSQSLAVAERVLQASDDQAARVNLAYALTLGRRATAAEVDQAQQYLASYELQLAVEATHEAPAPTAEQRAAAERLPDIAATDATGSGVDPAATAGAEAEKKLPVLDPDQVVETEAPNVEVLIEASSATAAAWSSFCQALLGSAEFRYVR